MTCAALALAGWPDGAMAGRDRELVARLTRSGVQRLDADGSHWTADATDLADTISPSPHPAQPLLTAGAVAAVAAPLHSTLLAAATVRRAVPQPVAPPGRDRAPPRR